MTKERDVNFYSSQRFREDLSMMTTMTMMRFVRVVERAFVPFGCRENELALSVANMIDLSNVRAIINKACITTVI